MFSTRSVLSLTVTACRDSQHPSPFCCCCCYSLPLDDDAYARHSSVRPVARTRTVTFLKSPNLADGTQGRYSRQARRENAIERGKDTKGRVGKTGDCTEGERGRTIHTRESGKLHSAAQRNDASSINLGTLTSRRHETGSPPAFPGAPDASIDASTVRCPLSPYLPCLLCCSRDEYQRHRQMGTNCCAPTTDAARSLRLG